MRVGGWLCVFLPICNQGFRPESTWYVCSEIPWLFCDLNWAETQFWAKMKEMVSDVSVKAGIFQPCSFINSLIYCGVFKEEREGLSSSPGANQQFTGWRRKEQDPRKTAGRQWERLILWIFCVLGPATLEYVLIFNRVHVKTDIKTTLDTMGTKNENWCERSFFL